MSKNMGRTDLGGQKSRDAGEGAGQPEKAPAKVKIQPDNPKPVRRFESDDDLMHFSRSAGLKVR